MYGMYVCMVCKQALKGNLNTLMADRGCPINSIVREKDEKAERIGDLGDWANWVNCVLVGN